MTPKILCFASAKGGVGKTIISAAFGKLLSGLGKKILLMDLDFATNGLSLFFLDELINHKKNASSGKDSLLGFSEATTSKLPTPFQICDSLQMIPSSYVMNQDIIDNGKFFSDLIHKTIKKYQKDFDFIIIDAQAGVTPFSESLFQISDSVVLISECDPISAKGIDRLKSLFPEILDYEKTWILYNKVLPESSEFPEEVPGNYLNVSRLLSPLPMDIEIIRRYAQRKFPIDMEKGNDYTVALIEVALTLFDKKIKNEIYRWKEEKENRLKLSTKDQLKEIEEEIRAIRKGLIYSEIELNNVSWSQRKLNYFLLTTVTIGSLIVYFKSNPLMDMISNFFSIKADSSLVILLLLFLGGIILSPLMISKRFFEKRTNRKAKVLKSQINALRDNLSELLLRRKRYNIILNSDLSLKELIKKESKTK